MRVGSVIPWRRAREVAPAWAEFAVPSLLRDVDRVLDDFWRGTEPTAFYDRAARTFAPDVDVEDTPTEVRVKADLPGLSDKDFGVSVEGDVLTISGERHGEESREENGRRWTERTYGKFERSVRLPAEVEVDKASATFSNGVLAVTLPKSAKARNQTLKIDVKSA